MINSSPSATYPAGFWPSLLSAEAVAQGKNTLSFPLAAQGWMFWQENLAHQANRGVLRGRPCDLSMPTRSFTPDSLVLGSRVHEYGGCAYAVADMQGRVQAAVVHKTDQSIWVCRDLLTKEPIWMMLYQSIQDRCGDLQLCPWGVVAVIERNGQSDQLPENLLQCIAWDGSVRLVHQGQDFYAGLQFSDDYRYLTFLSWQRPVMPWEDTQLWITALDNDAVQNHPQFSPAKIVQDQPQTAVFQPMFTTDNRLLYVSDHSGFANLYHQDLVESLFAVDWECSLPLWQLGMRTYAVIDENTLVVCAADQGVWRLGYLCRLSSKSAWQWREISLDGAHPEQPIAVGDGFAALIKPQDKAEYVAYFPVICGDLQQAVVINADEYAGVKTTAKPWVVRPQSHHFFGQYGAVQGYWYLPQGSGDTPPPVIIRSHGGPSGQTDPAYRAKYQYWLTRGFALFDINYSGSTGFGRAYRQRLDNGWGIVDRDDCLDGLRYLLQLGRVDGDHAFISGSSAGGLTTLNCLCHSDLFSGGTSVYGVADLQSLAAITHKFEVDYLDSLIGSLPLAQAEYRARSPLYHADKISAPVLFLHGGKDPVVPLGQMLNMAAAIQQKHGATAAETEIYPNEGHGFRDPETIALALERECDFYRRILSQ